MFVFDQNHLAWAKDTTQDLGLEKAKSQIDRMFSPQKAKVPYAIKANDFIFDIGD